MDRKSVAAESGLSYPYVAQIENGEREPSLRALQALADALSLPLSDLTDAVSQSATPMSAPSGAGYHANPAFPAAAPAPASKRMKRSRAAASVDADMVLSEMAVGSAPEPSKSTTSSRRRYVMVQVMDLLESLPPRERLAVLTDAQAQVLQDVVDDEVRRRT